MREFLKEMWRRFTNTISVLVRHIQKNGPWLCLLMGLYWFLIHGGLMAMTLAWLWQVAVAVGNMIMVVGVWLLVMVLLYVLWWLAAFILVGLGNLVQTMMGKPTVTLS